MHNILEELGKRENVDMSAEDFCAAQKIITKVVPQPKQPKTQEEIKQQPNVIKSIEEKLKELVERYPDLKPSIVNAMISDLIKTGQITSDQIEEIRRFANELKPAAPVTKYQAHTPSIQKYKTYTKPKFTKADVTKLEDYENFVPVRFPVYVYF